jgi:hypothetical protein
MSLPFSGPARPLSSIDFARAAQALGCELEAVEAVRTVEAGGSGFLGDDSGRPIILYEAHRFAKETGGRFNISHPRLSVAIWDRSLYAGGATEYVRLASAIALNRAGALRATSWGLFQILGSNHKAAGYPDVESFVAAMTDSEGAHLDAFVSFVRFNGLAGHLVRRDWAAFAAATTAQPTGRTDTTINWPRPMRGAKGRAVAWPTALRIGMRGEAVSKLQLALNRNRFSAVVDGIFGRVTVIAVEQFQASRGLVSDGVVGPKTRRRSRPLDVPEPIFPRTE